MAELAALESVTAGYGDAKVLDDVSLAVEEGDSLALLGRNGVGKSTLLVTLMGITRVHRGSVRFAGRDMASGPHASPRPRRPGLGSAGTPHVAVAHRRGAPDVGGAARGMELGTRLRDVPAPRGAARQLRQPAVRRRAADGRHRPRPHGQSAAPAAGRTDGGAGADDRAGTAQRHPRPGEGRQHGHRSSSSSTRSSRCRSRGRRSCSTAGASFTARTA